MEIKISYKKVRNLFTLTQKLKKKKSKDNKKA